MNALAESAGMRERALALAEIAASMRTNGADAHTLALELAKRHPDEPAPLRRLAADTACIRPQLASAQSWSAQGLFTQSAYEQASDPVLARLHAERFQGCTSLIEIGTAAGFDCAALARVVPEIVTLEPDPLLAEVARHNLALQGLSNVTVHNLDLEAFLAQPATPRFDALWADPMRRRAGGERVSNPDEYSPTLTALLSLAIGARRGIKISPGLNLDALPPGWSREFIGRSDECPEQLLWYGTPTPDRSVTLADAGVSWSETSGAPRAAVAGTLPQAGDYLYEPHGALIRTQALAAFYGERSVQLIDSQIAYGFSGTLLESSPWYRAFRVVDAAPYSRRAVLPLLKAHSWTDGVEIKKRGFPQTPEEIRRELKLPAAGSPVRTLFFTRRGDAHLVILAERL